MQLVQTITVGAGGANLLEFANIPQSGTDILIVASFRDNRTSAGNDFGLLINTTYSTYRFRTFWADGSNRGTLASSGSQAYGTFLSQPNNFLASTFSNIQAYIPNYTAANAKSIAIDGVTETNSTTAYMSLNANSFDGTAAVTNIKVYTGAPLLQHSTASLYLINKA